jgi:hypothetical protein
MKAARAPDQNRLCMSVVRHHRRQRATVRRFTPKSCDTRAIRVSVAPYSMAEISTTIGARYTRGPKNRTDGGVARSRHPSTAQQKLNRQPNVSASRPAGSPLARISHRIECIEAPNQRKLLCPMPHLISTIIVEFEQQFVEPRVRQQNLVQVPLLSC